MILPAFMRNQGFTFLKFYCIVQDHSSGFLKLLRHVRVPVVASGALRFLVFKHPGLHSSGMRVRQTGSAGWISADPSDGGEN
jgi:hypothetical protein